MARTSHYWLSTPSRNARIVTQINQQNATIDSLVAEYGISWEDIVASLHDTHYHLQTQPDVRDADAWRIYRGNLTRFNKLISTAAANTRAAQATKTIAQNPVQEPTKEPDNKATFEPAPKPVQTTGTAKINTLADTSTNASSHALPCVYLVETGYLLNTNFSNLLAMDGGKALFMIPRFCINELKRIAMNKEDISTMNKANDILLKMYSENVWQKRFVPFEPVEQGLIPKTPDIMGYKNRSFGIAEAALEIYVCSDRRIHVLTSAMEIQHLVTRMVKNEGLETEILVTRIYRK